MADIKLNKKIHCSIKFCFNTALKLVLHAGNICVSDFFRLYLHLCNGLGYNKMVTTYQIQLKLEVVLQQFIDVLLFASIIAF